jgi:hypothetical protein
VLWQAGFYRTVAETFKLAPARVCWRRAPGRRSRRVLFAGCFDAALAHFKRATAANSRNVHLAKPLQLVRRYFRMRQCIGGALLEVIDDRTLATLHAGPELRVAIYSTTGWLGARSGFAVAGSCRRARAPARPAGTPSACARLGFRAEYATVSACRTPEALADLVLASSCTPPLTPLLMQGGRPSLDGGIADNVPVARWPTRPARRSSCLRDAMAAAGTFATRICAAVSPRAGSELGLHQSGRPAGSLRPRAARRRKYSRDGSDTFQSPCLRHPMVARSSPEHRPAVRSAGRCAAQWQAS